MDEMKKGISQFKQQFAQKEDSKVAGWIGVYSRIVEDFDTSKRFLEMAYHMEKQANNARCCDE
ncbi:hypothetical protein [Paenibacillus apiarius]|nr:hypothetical protein [Paenibacillus apiarius]MBN3527382.1 hypothetical protein [Paenibacillus apiarius]